MPSVRGWAALLVPLLGGFLFLASIPERFDESGVGVWIGGRISLLGWLSGALLILVSAVACLEALRRGSSVDRVIACVAALLTFWLITQYLELFLLPVRRPPNHRAGADAGVALVLQAEHQRPGPAQHDRQSNCVCVRFNRRSLRRPRSRCVHAGRYRHAGYNAVRRRASVEN
jgi:hypothetical protein